MLNCLKIMSLIIYLLINVDKIKIWLHEIIFVYFKFNILFWNGKIECCAFSKFRSGPDNTSVLVDYFF